MGWAHAWEEGDEECIQNSSGGKSRLKRPSSILQVTLREMCCEDGSWMELAKDHVQCGFDVSSAESWSSAARVIQLFLFVS
jgi:hypothetical protein